MRILTLTNLYPNPYEPGRAPFNRQQFRALAAEHAVRVIAPIAWTDELTARWRLRRVARPESSKGVMSGHGGVQPRPSQSLRTCHTPRLQRGRRAVCDGLPVEHPLYLYPPKLLRGCYGHLYRSSVRRTFRRTVAEFQPDLIFAPWAYPDGWAAVELGHAAGLPVVIKVHGSDVLRLDRDLINRVTTNIGRRTAQALSRADGVVAVSRDLAERVVALGADSARVRVVYDGVDLKSFQPGAAREARARLDLQPSGKMLLFVGRLVPVKALDVLIDACAELVRRGLPISCFLVGEGPCRPSLERQIDRLGLRSFVRLAGSVPHDRLPDWYRAADLVVLPSHSEGVPSVLLEAAACGRPFVASHVGGIPEIAHLTPNRLTPAGDICALATAIEAALAGDFEPAATGTARLRSVEEAAIELADFLGQVRYARRGGRPVFEPCLGNAAEDL